MIHTATLAAIMNKIRTTQQRTETLLANLDLYLAAGDDSTSDRVSNAHWQLEALADESALLWTAVRVLAEL